MLEFQIRFDFQRYAEGYALEPDPSGAKGSAPGNIIVPKGVAPLSYLPFEKFDSLYSAFAEIFQMAARPFISKIETEQAMHSRLIARYRNTMINVKLKFIQ